MEHFKALLAASGEGGEKSSTATPFPDTFLKDDLLHFTQPVPFLFTLWLQPRPLPPLQLDAFVFRFTTFQSSEAPLPAKQSYSFSPLPPLLSIARKAPLSADAEGNEADSAFTFASRLAQQMNKQPEELRLALLRPKQYQLMDCTASKVDALALEPGAPPHPFDEWLADASLGRQNLQLGLLDSSTPHSVSTSSRQRDVAELTKGSIGSTNTSLFKPHKPAGIVLGKS